MKSTIDNFSFMIVSTTESIKKITLEPYNVVYLTFSELLFIESTGRIVEKKLKTTMKKNKSHKKTKCLFARVITCTNSSIEIRLICHMMAQRK